MIIQADVARPPGVEEGLFVPRAEFFKEKDLCGLSLILVRRGGDPRDTGYWILDTGILGTCICY